MFRWRNSRSGKYVFVPLLILGLLMPSIEVTVSSPFVTDLFSHNRKNIVDKIYLARQNKNVVDNFKFSTRKAEAAENPNELEYVVDVGPIVGSTAANYVYASFFNPSGSGRTAVVKRILVRSNATSTANYINLTVRRTTAASAGTQITAANIPKKHTTSADSVVEVRHTNVTVSFAGVTDSRILGQPGAGLAGSAFSVRDITFGDTDEKLILQPGEGIALYQEAAGDIDFRNRMYVEWEEVASAPAATDEFLFAFPRVENAAGVNYIYNSFFNPGASGKTAIVKRIWFGAETCDAAAVYTNNIALNRITAASGGTSVTASNIPKKHTGSSNSTMEFRYLNPTVTLVGATTTRLGLVTPCGAAGQPSGWMQLDFHKNDEKLILQPGEGVALRSEAAGDADQIVRMIVEWEEVSSGSTPSSEGEYILAYPNIATTTAVAANTNFFTFFNPSGSGKTAVVKRIGIRNNAVAAANYASTTWRRITTASNGVQIPAADIPQKHSDTGASVIEARYCGDTCNTTLSATYVGNQDSRLMTVIGPGAVGQVIGQREIVFGDNEKIVLQEGEGIGFYNQTAGDADQRFKVFVEWDEENSAPSAQSEYLVDVGTALGNTGANYVYASLFNPGSSGKTAVIKRVSIRVDAQAAITTAVPVTLRRITDATGGTAITAANVPKKNTSSANTAMDVRRTGVTVTFAGTTDSRLVGVQTPTTVGAAGAPSTTGYKELLFENDEKIILRPGEGVALYQEAGGDVDLRPKLLVEWEEINSSATPVSDGDYLLSTGPINGNATANYVYSSFFNPATSTKNYIVKRIEVRVDRIGAATAPAGNPATIRRTTSASAGTILSAADVPKKNTGAATSSADVRHTNVTVSLAGGADSRLLGVTIPAAVNQEMGIMESQIVYLDEIIIGPGEGLALFQEAAAGDTNLRYRMALVWEEEPALVAVVSATGTQIAGVDASSTDQYLGGVFVITGVATNTQAVTSISLVETGTIDAQNNLDNIKLLYDLDTTAPYDCASVSYGGSETQFGSTALSFTASNGTSTFSGSESVSTTTTMCVYVVLEVASTSSNGDTIDVQITNPSTDVTVTTNYKAGGEDIVALSGSTSVRKPILTQVHYHFRNDDGSESGATSGTSGTEDAPRLNLVRLSPLRLRVEVSNEGSTSSASTQYRLEYGTKNVTCDAATGWTDVGAGGGAFDMFDSANLTDGSDTTNIAVSAGGTTNENVTFKTPNGGVKDTGSETSGVALTESQYIELEYSIEATASATAGESYCFRVTNAGTVLPSYLVYPEVSINPNKDFFIQRGVTTLSGTSATITAGTDYTAPSASTSAFIRITNTQLTGAGTDSGGGTQNAQDVTAYITNPSNIFSSITFARAGSTGNTRVAWEIVEYIGPSNGDNEVIVRGQGTNTFDASALAASSTVNGVTDANDVVVFVTGIGNPDTGTSDYNTGLVTGKWNTSTNEAVFERGEAGSDAVNVSFAVVEFKGRNWSIQRVEHTYGAVGTTETENITSVNSISRTFLHAQKRVGAGLDTLANFGQEVWLSSTGAVSFTLESTATSPGNHVGVAWVIENTQTSGTPMVVTRSNGTQSGGGIPATSNINIGTTLSDLTVASIFTNNRVSNSTTEFPRAMMAVRIISTTQYELWVSDSGETRTYRTEVVEWPTAVQTIAQNYYRFYDDNNALKPTDAWPPGATNLGENTSITDTDTPLNQGDNIRIRMSIKVSGATFAASTDTFKLQYGRRSTSCSAIASWFDIGEVGSTTAAWRAVNNTPAAGTALSGNPPSGGDLVLSVSDRAGTYEEGNPSALNPYRIYVSEDAEYDWVFEDFSAPDRATYCFRMVLGNGTALDTYNFYPTLVTSGFVPKTQNWRWYGDETNETPSADLAAENTSPIDITNTDILKLRITAKEISAHTGQNVKFKLQFSRYSDFSAEVTDVVDSGVCLGNSLWCYADGGGTDNATVTAKVLSDVDACSGGVGNGCGTHNESSSTPSTFVQQANAATEYEFTIKHAGARTNTTYFFRLYDTSADLPVEANTGETYPSLSTEGSTLSASITGLPSGTNTEGVTTDITTTPTSVPFGTLPIGTARTAAYRFNISTNATQGYTIYISQDQGLLASNGAEILPVTGTNSTPSAWASGCPGPAIGCFGYHTGDDTLSEGSSRFLSNDTFAQFETTPREIAYSSVPVIGETIDFIFKILVSNLQAAGSYQNTVQYIVVPVY